VACPTNESNQSYEQVDADSRLCRRRFVHHFFPGFDFPGNIFSFFKIKIPLVPLHLSQTDINHRATAHEYISEWKAFGMSRGRIIHMRRWPMTGLARGLHSTISMPMYALLCFHLENTTADRLILAGVPGQVSSHPIKRALSRGTCRSSITT
jgi:hypothetical protein